MKNKVLGAFFVFFSVWALSASGAVLSASGDSKSESNVESLKAKEKSTANKLLDGASMGTIGIGASQALSAQSEKSADADAEQDMKAYLATFRCDYGQGRNILGGQTNVQLPGDVELIQYVAEYKRLAADLKSDKAALGIKPGIEADVILDSVATGLYDDVGLGRSVGAFTSLSRAIMDENSADAIAWQAQKDASAKKLKNGITVAGAGIVGSIAGNALVSVATDGKLKNIFGRGTVDAKLDSAGINTSGIGNILDANGNNASLGGGRASQYR